METKPLTMDNVRAVLEEFGKAVREEYVGDLIALDKPTSRNTLAGTARYVLEEDNGTYELMLSLQDYWKYVEYGRQPGKKPPYSKILEWVQIKPIIPRPDERTGKIPTEGQLAGMIMHSIEQNGIAATHSLKEAVRITDERFRERIAEAARRDFAIYIKTLLVDGQLTKEDGAFTVLQSFDITEG